MALDSEESPYPPCLQAPAAPCWQANLSPPGISLLVHSTTTVESKRNKYKCSRSPPSTCCSWGALSEPSLQPPAGQAPISQASGVMVECTTCRLQQESGRQQRQTASGSRLPPPYRNPFHQTRMSCCWRARGSYVQSAASAARVQVRALRGFARIFVGEAGGRSLPSPGQLLSMLSYGYAARLANLQGRCGPTRPSAQPLPASSTCRCRTFSAGGCCAECLGRATLLSDWLPLLNPPCL